MLCEVLCCCLLLLPVRSEIHAWEEGLHGE
jgi:hypothetical protein